MQRHAYLLQIINILFTIVLYKSTIELLFRYIYVIHILYDFITKLHEAFVVMQYFD